MDIIMSRSDASWVYSGLEFLVRLSLGQLDEISMINRLSAFGDGELYIKMRLSDGLSDDIQSWCKSSLGMSSGGYFGIFSPHVSDNVREMMAISKMLREGVIAAYSNAETGDKAPEWTSIDLNSALLAYDVSCRVKASAFAGNQPSGLPSDVEVLVCEKGGLQEGDLDCLEGDAKVYLSLPNVNAEWFHDMAGIGCRAYWSLTRREGYASIGLSAIGEWIERDTSLVCKRLEEQGTGAFLEMIQKTLDRL